MRLRLPITIILAGLLFRLYQSGSYPFGFDQVQIIENAQEILRGNITLIGPRTGPAAMFTGPLIYYITAAFMLFLNPIQALIVTTVCIAAITGIVIYTLTRKTTTALIWASSPFLIGLDRVPWNPNLSVLAASLVFFPFLGKKPLTPGRILCICLGIFLGYQAHFSGLMLVALALLGWALSERSRWYLPPLFILSWVSSLIPTILFDYRHQWVNATNLMSFLTSQDTVSRFDSMSRLIRMIYISIENAGKLLVATSQSILILSVGIFVLVSYVILRIKRPGFTWLPLIWIGSVALLFSLYRGQTPEYYFLIQTPALMFMASQVISSIRPRRLVSLVYVMCILYAAAFTHQLVLNPTTFSLNEQQTLVDELKTVDITIKEIVYDMEPIEAVGLQYLLRNTTTSGGVETVHLIYPYEPGHLATGQFGRTAYWIDPRSKENANYTLTPHYLITTPTNLQVFQSNSIPPYFSQSETYVMTLNNQVIGDLEVFDYESPKHYQKNRQLFETCHTTQDGFMDFNGRYFFRRCEKPFVYTFFPMIPLTAPEVDQLLADTNITGYFPTQK